MSDTNQLENINKSKPLKLNDLSDYCAFCNNKGHNYLNCNDERLIYFDSTERATYFNNFIDDKFHDKNKEYCNTFECEICDEFLVENEDNKPIKLKLKNCQHVLCKECFDSLIAKTLYNNK
jgi:hypothetical protein